MLSSSFVGSTRLSSAAARAGGASLYGARVAPVVATPRPIGLVVEAAHKKGSGHSKNGRDSVSKVRLCFVVSREKRARKSGGERRR